MKPTQKKPVSVKSHTQSESDKTGVSTGTVSNTLTSVAAEQPKAARTVSPAERTASDM